MKTEVFGLKTLAILDHIALAVAYQKIYATAPWGEWKKCSNHECKQYWGIEQKQQLEEFNFRHCDLPVQDYWPTDWLLEEFKRISTLPEFNVTVAYNVNLGKMIGFCWGYQVDIESLDEKFQLTRVRERVVSKINDSKPLIYLSEIVVDSDYHRHGVAQKLIKLYFEQNRHHGWMIARTRKDSVVNMWFSRLGFDLLLPYNDERGRELQFIEIHNLVE